MFDVTRSSDGTCDWLLTGELDLATAGDLNTVILPWLEERHSEGGITFDVSGLTFLDSTGVRTLYSLCGPPYGGNVILRHPTEVVWRALAIAGLASEEGAVPDEVIIEHAGEWEPI